MGLFDWFRPKPQPKFEIKDLDGNIIHTFPWPSLSGHDLSGLVFHNAQLSGLDMRDCICRGTVFTGSKFVGTTLRGADLRDAAVDFCDLTQAKLMHAKIAGTDFTATEFGRGTKRADLDDVIGIREAIISPYELVHAGRFNSGRGKDRHHKLTKVKAMAASKRRQLPVRPRSLLVLEELGWQRNNYAQPPRGSHRS
jgi:hypothetical protein